MTRGGLSRDPTVRERIIIHLHDMAPQEPDGKLTLMFTQPGIAQATSIERKHVAQYTRPLVEEGLVVERLAHVEGSRQRRKAYFLTLAGRKEATRIRAAFLDQVVILESEGRRATMTLREATGDRFLGMPFLEILRGIDKEGILRVKGTAAPARPTPRPPPVPSFEDARRALERARTSEQRHDWVGAEAVYREALDLLPPSQAAIRSEVLERGALSSFRLAFQADSHDAFRMQMARSLERYEETREALHGLPEGSEGRARRCDAMVAYAHYWLATDAPTKRAAAAEAYRFVSRALRAFDEAGEKLEYGRTFNEFAFVVNQNCAFVETREAFAGIKEDIVRWGERAIDLLDPAGDRVELAKACAITSSALHGRGAYAPALQQESRRKAPEYWRWALRLCEAEAYGAFRVGPSLWGAGTEEAIEVYEKILDQARAWKDVLGMAYAMDDLQFHEVSRAEGLEDLGAQIALCKKALQLALEAKRLYAILGHDRIGIGGFSIGDPLAYYHRHLANLETDREKKRDLLELARESAQGLLAWAEALCAPRILASEHSFIADVLVALSRLEIRPEPRRRLLEQALGHAEKGVEIAEPVEIFLINLGVYHDSLAQILAELSNLSSVTGDSVAYLQKAVAEKERSLRLYTDGQMFFEGVADPSGHAEIGKLGYELGLLYDRLADRSGDREPLTKAVPAFEEAVVSYEKPGLASRIAECHWRAAQAHDHLGDFMKAAEAFRRAREAYGLAAARLPALRARYEDHAFLMEAWTEIEEARARHARRDYGRAKEGFEKAAILHRASRRWAYLAPNYLAWARLEEAEDESRKEHSEEAIRAFREAATLFEETGSSLRARRKDGEDPDEERLVARLADASLPRRRYCEARVTFEEGRALEASGDPGSAADKFRLATERFDALLWGLESDEDRRDVGLILALSRASHRMAQAESTGTAEDYRDASTLFENAAKLAGDERSRLLALGHARLCEAWDAGTRFLDTRNRDAYEAALQSLQGAEDCYRRAGGERSAIQAHASRILFDAWSRLEEADRARSPAEKASRYKIAERLLRLAATSLEKAGPAHVKERVKGLLEQVGREREMAVSLANLLRAPALPVSTSAFATPAQTHESSTGLVPIEHADLQANLVARRKAVRRTEPLVFRIEIVNAGRAAARLLRIEALIPDGFELLRTPRTDAVQGRSLDLRGRRLEPLESDAVTLTLKPRNEGTFRVAPRIFYVDESGNSKVCRPAPLEITVARTATPAPGRSRRRP